MKIIEKITITDRRLIIYPKTLPVWKFHIDRDND